MARGSLESLSPELEDVAPPECCNGTEAGKRGRQTWWRAVSHLLGELLRGTWNEVLGKSRCSGQETRDVRYVQQARLTLRVPSPGLTQLHTS